jgi:hypothetical protein
MHTATAVLPSWLKQRNESSYWNNFHKWRFNTSDPLSVFIKAEQPHRNLYIWWYKWERNAAQRDVDSTSKRTEVVR